MRGKVRVRRIVTSAKGTVRISKKGGPGSGNWGHGGLHGEHGGSGEQDGADIEKTPTKPPRLPRSKKKPGRSSGSKVTWDYGDGKMTGTLVKVKPNGTLVVADDDGRCHFLTKWSQIEYNAVVEGEVQEESMLKKTEDEPKAPSNKNSVSVYHGTSEKWVNDIVSIGIPRYEDLEIGRPDSVFYTEDRDMAERYGKGSLRGPDSKYAIVEFKVPEGADPIPDEIGSEGDYRIEHEVPAESIVSVIVYDARGNIVRKIEK